MGCWDGIRQDAKNVSVEDLNKLHTKTLLRILKSLRSIISQIHLDILLDRASKDNADLISLIDYRTRVKEVLSTREHIPNKKEAKQIRQEKARRKN